MHPRELPKTTIATLSAKLQLQALAKVKINMLAIECSNPRMTKKEIKDTRPMYFTHVILAFL